MHYTEPHLYLCYFIFIILRTSLICYLLNLTHELPHMFRWKRVQGRTSSGWSIHSRVGRTKVVIGFDLFYSKHIHFVIWYGFVLFFYWMLSIYDCFYIANEICMFLLVFVKFIMNISLLFPNICYYVMYLYTLV